MEPKPKKWVFAFLAMFIAGGTLRFLGVFNDLWLDEIISLNLARQAGSPLEILTLIYSDNNHVLNTWWLYFVGPWGSVFLDRLLALLCGVQLLISVALVEWPHGLRQRLFALALCSFSYLLVLYSSEARGYMPMLSLAAALMCLLPLYERERRLTIAMLVWLGAVLGFLSQFTFAHFYAAFLGWSSLRAYKRGGRPELFETLAVLHLAPLAFFVVIYFVHIQYMPPGSGALRPYLDTIVNLISLGFGGPQLSALNIKAGAVALLLAAALFVIALIELTLLWRQGSDWWFFYALSVFVAPLLSVVVLEPRVLYERYLLVGQLGLYFLTAGFLARIYEKSVGGKVISLLLLSAFVAGNIGYIKELVVYGRGNYRQALSYIAGQSVVKEIFLSGDHDFRNSKVVDYYKESFKAEHEFVYFTSDKLQSAGAQFCPGWYLMHSQDRFFPPPKVVSRSANCSYSLDKEFPSALLSGWRWFVYKAYPVN